MKCPLCKHTQARFLRRTILGRVYQCLNPECVTSFYPDEDEFEDSEIAAGEDYLSECGDR